MKKSASGAEEAAEQSPMAREVSSAAKQAAEKLFVSVWFLPGGRVLRLLGVFGGGLLS